MSFHVHFVANYIDSCGFLLQVVGILAGTLAIATPDSKCPVRCQIVRTYRLLRVSCWRLSTILCSLASDNWLLRRCCHTNLGLLWCIQGASKGSALNAGSELFLRKRHLSFKNTLSSTLSPSHLSSELQLLGQSFQLRITTPPATSVSPLFTTSHQHLPFLGAQPSVAKEKLSVMYLPGWM